MAQFFTNFSEYTVGENPPSGWSKLAPGGGAAGNYEVIEYQGKKLLAGYGYEIKPYLAKWDHVGSSGEIDMVIKYSQDEGGATTNTIVPFGVAVALSSSGNSGYAVGLMEPQPEEYTLQVRRFTTALGINWSNIAAQPVSVNPANVLKLRVQVFEKNIRARIWTDGETEPVTWHIDISHSNVTAGEVALCGGYTNSFPPSEAEKAKFYAVAIGTAGSAAPDIDQGEEPGGPTTHTAHGSIHATATFAAEAILISGASGTPSLIATDFSEYPMAEGPPPGWTPRYSPTGRWAIRQGNRLYTYREGTYDAIPIAISWDDAGTGENIEITVAQSHGGTSGDRLIYDFGTFGAIVRASDNGGYVAGFKEPDLFVITRLDKVGTSWVETDLATMNVPVPPTGLQYIRFRIDGENLYAKHWRSIDPEPDDWQLQTTDTTYASGWIGLISWTFMADSASDNARWYSVEIANLDAVVYDLGGYVFATSGFIGDATTLVSTETTGNIVAASEITANASISYNVRGNVAASAELTATGRLAGDVAPSTMATDFYEYPLDEHPWDWTKWDPNPSDAYTRWAVVEPPGWPRHLATVGGMETRSRGLSWDSVGVVGDAEVVMKVYGSASYAAAAEGPILRGQVTSLSVPHGYMAGFLDIGGRRFVIAKVAAGILTELASVSFTTLSGFYWIRFRAEGNLLRAKYWRNGTPEPGWMLEATDSTYASGWVGISTFTIINPICFFFGVGLNGAAAPMSVATVHDAVGNVASFASMSGVATVSSTTGQEHFGIGRANAFSSFAAFASVVSSQPGTIDASGRLDATSSFVASARSSVGGRGTISAQSFFRLYLGEVSPIEMIPFMKLNNLVIPLIVDGGATFTPEYVGDIKLTFSGRALNQRRRTRFVGRFETTPLKPELATSIAGIIEGRGDAWNFERDLASTRGLMPLAANASLVPGQGKCIRGGGILISGSTGRIEYDPSFINWTAFTFMGWARVNTLTEGVQQIVSVDAGTHVRNRMLFAIQGSPKKLNLYYGDAGIDANVGATNYTVVAGGGFSWAITFDGRAYRIYINGELDKEKIDDVVITPAFGATLKFGGGSWGTLEGVLSDIQILPYAASAEEIKAAHEATCTVGYRPGVLVEGLVVPQHRRERGLIAIGTVDEESVTSFGENGAWYPDSKVIAFTLQERGD